MAGCRSTILLCCSPAAQQALAKKFTRECESLGLAVFFDEDVTEEMWCRDVVMEFRHVSGGELARYVVPFLSKEYFDSDYPMDDFAAVITHDPGRRHYPFLLPITVGDVEIPEEFVRSSIGYLKSENYSVEQLARIAFKRVKGTDRLKPLGSLEAGLARFGERFRDVQPSLARFGCACHQRTGDSSVDFASSCMGARCTE